MGTKVLSRIGNRLLLEGIEVSAVGDPEEFDSTRISRKDRWLKRLSRIALLLSNCLLSLSLAFEKSNVEAYVCLGRNYRRLGWDHMAMMSFYKAVESSGWKLELEREKAKKYFELCSLDAVFEEFKKTKQNPWYPYSKIVLARRLFEAQSYKDAYFVVESVLRVEPQNSLFLYEKGKILVKMRKYDRAIDVFKEMRSIDPKNYRIYLHLCDLYRYIGMYDKALKELDMVRKRDCKLPGLREAEDKVVAAIKAEQRFSC